MLKQRIVGALLLLLCMIMIVNAAGGQTIEEQDVTPVLLLLPLGIYALVSRQRILHASMYTQPSGKKTAQKHRASPLEP